MIELLVYKIQESCAASITTKPAKAILGGSIMAFNHFSLGAKIQAVRKKRRLTQMELAEKINRSPTYLSYVENGCRGMSLETLVDVANALQVTADELLADSLENTAAVYSRTFTGILRDCSPYEQRILLDIAVAAKKALRDHRRHFRRR